MAESINNNLFPFSHQTILQNFEALEKKTDELVPDSHFQNKMDNLAAQIKEKFTPLTQFNQWLAETNQEEAFYINLSKYLIKLPLRSAQKIVTSLYNVISTALYIGVHPIKGSQQLVKNLYILMHELTKPETWPKMGAGSIGFLAGQSLVLGNPISLMGFAIGGGLIASGVTFSSLLNIVHSEDGKELETLKETLKQELKNLPDQMMVGLFTGLLFGGITRAFSAKEKPITTRPEPRPVDPGDEMHILPIDDEMMHISHLGGPIHVKPFINSFETTPNVAQWQGASWDNLVKNVSDVSLAEAKAIASSDSNIDFFFYVDNYGFNLTQGSFSPGDAVFFSGEPWWGSAPGSTGYVKV